MEKQSKQSEPQGKYKPLAHDERTPEAGYCHGCGDVLVPVEDDIQSYECIGCSALYTSDSRGRLRELARMSPPVCGGTSFDDDPISVDARDMGDDSVLAQMAALNSNTSVHARRVWA